MKLDDGFGIYYPFAKLKNLIMVAGHSVYTSSSCEKTDKEDSWFLESYQKNLGQAATFLAHIKEGIERTTLDDEALLLFSGKRSDSLYILEGSRVTGKIGHPTFIMELKLT
ncbi:hypothetical protein Goklo_000855, partial [Gossypium klotzschianum]|nr:hypothetical protein [Gossypium klotzschianum]